MGGRRGNRDSSTKLSLKIAFFLNLWGGVLPRGCFFTTLAKLVPAVGERLFGKMGGRRGNRDSSTKLTLKIAFFPNLWGRVLPKVSIFTTPAKSNNAGQWEGAERDSPGACSSSSALKSKFIINLMPGSPDPGMRLIVNLDLKALLLQPTTTTGLEPLQAIRIH